MEENMVKLHYTVSDEDFSVAGEASSSVKKTLRQLGISNDVIRKVSIAMYECEINMVIHACGGEIDVEITPQKIRMIHKDKGPGIKDIEKAMTEGYSTASSEVRNMGFGAGMGLPNMKRNSDDFTIESEVGKGTDIVMSFNI